jgi:hypothetical protein
MTLFTIVQHERKESFGNYPYSVHLGGRKVAVIEHDYRGDEHYVRIPNGPWQACDKILTGGGPEPLGLTAEGNALISKLIAQPT